MRRKLELAFWIAVALYFSIAAVGKLSREAQCEAAQSGGEG